ncbi:MAG: NAD(P)H-binding protein [Bifidobacterium sp.]|uniref:NAD(P)H-binding protein n=1 Tax=Bifidobacterium fermentum TaxID=3059035 RepID=A0AB39UNJ5_9BIFI
MSNVLILGANGQIARLVRKRLLADTDAQLTLYLRNSRRLGNIDPRREKIVDADVNDGEALQNAISGQDLIYANLGGEFEPMARKVVDAMEHDEVSRLIWVTGLGLYHEVPGEFGRWVDESIGSEIMEDTRRAARIIESSPLDATIIRAAYMNNDPTVDYELTHKGEPFKGTVVSRSSIADLIVHIITDPTLYSNESLGIAQPGTDGNRPW